MSDDHSSTKGRRTYHAVKLLIIRDFLLSNTDNNHYVTSKDIIKHLESFGIRADRKTIFSDIDHLEFDYGMEIVRGKGYRVASPKFEPRELRLMIDSVQSAHFITETEAASITSKIKDLADIYTRPTLERKAYVNERIRRKSDSVVVRSDVIHEAISLDAQVSFKYVHYYPSLGKENKRYSKKGNPYIVSPFALYWNNGNYYLYAYLSEEQGFRYFRIDRMEAIKLETNKREGHELYKSLSPRGHRKAKVFDMYSTGNEVMVTLRGSNKLADQIIDAFGNDVMLAPDREEGYFVTKVLVDVSPTFFAWLSTFGNGLVIAAPEEIRGEMKAFLQKSLSQY